MSDWQGADRQNLGMYKGFIRLTVVAGAAVIVTLIVLAIWLL